MSANRRWKEAGVIQNHGSLTEGCYSVTKDAASIGVFSLTHEKPITSHTRGLCDVPTLRPFQNFCSSLFVRIPMLDEEERKQRPPPACVADYTRSSLALRSPRPCLWQIYEPASRWRGPLQQRAGIGKTKRLS